MNKEQVNRQQKQKQVKSRISEILTSVKDQKQHIQNQLARNDKKIQIYCQQYQQLRSQNDFSQLSEAQRTILQQLIQGLQNQHRIDSALILGTDIKKMMVGGQNQRDQNDQNDSGENQQQPKQLKQLGNQQILRIQSLLIDKLSSRLNSH